MATSSFKPAQRKRITVATDTDQPETINTLLGGDSNKGNTTSKSEKSSINVKASKPAQAQHLKSKAATSVSTGSKVDDIIAKIPSLSKTPVPKESPEVPALTGGNELQNKTEDTNTLADNASPIPTPGDTNKEQSADTNPVLSEDELRVLRKTYHVPVEKIARHYEKKHIWIWLSAAAVGVLIGTGIVYLFVLS